MSTIARVGGYAKMPTRESAAWRQIGENDVIWRRDTRRKGIDHGGSAGGIDDNEIECIFRRHDAIFGDTYKGVYSTAVVLGAFLCQVLADDNMRSCAAAVARVCNFLIAVGNNPSSTDTGEYCNARKPRGVSAAEVAETGRRISHHARLCDRVVGDRMCPGRRLGSERRQADG